MVLSLCLPLPCILVIRFFFFNDTATTEIYTLSLHDALPISVESLAKQVERTFHRIDILVNNAGIAAREDRKSTRLNSSHTVISYAVFCLKKKNYPHEPVYQRTHKTMQRLAQMPQYVETAYRS